MSSFTFKTFLLNEQQAYLAQKIGNILSAVQELKADAKNMGTRDLYSFVNEIVTHMRNILHSSWPKEQEKHLQVIQKMATALMKCMDDKGDLPAMISAVSGNMEKLVADLGVPINKLVPTEPAKDSTQDKKGISGTETKQQEPPPADSQKQASGQPPTSPETMDSDPQGLPPTGGTGQDMAAPPLGGNSTGGLDGF